MKNRYGKRNQSYSEKNLKSQWCGSGFILLLAFILAVTFWWPVYKIGYPYFEQMGTAYWGYSRIWLGESFWQRYLEANSSVSFGYGLCLWLAAKLMGKTSFVYKIVLLVQSMFWLASYFYMVKVTKRIWPQDGLAELASFFALLLPLYFPDRLFMGPNAVLMLIMYMLLDWGYQIKKPWAAGVLLAIGMFFYSGMLAVAIAVFIFLCILAWQKQITGADWREAVVSLGIGVCLVAVAEQILTMLVWGETVLNAQAGILGYIDCMRRGFDSNGILGIFGSIMGGWFSLLTGSCFIVLPGLDLLYKMVKQGGDNIQKRFALEILLTGAAVFFLEAVSRTYFQPDIKVFQDVFVRVAAVPMIIVGIIQVQKMIAEPLSYYGQKALLAIGIIFLSAGLASDYIKRAGEALFDGLEYGILILWDDFSHYAKDLPVLTVAILLLVVVTIWSVYKVLDKLLKISLNKTKKNEKIFLLMVGMVFCFLAVLHVNMFEKLALPRQEQGKIYRKMEKIMKEGNSIAISVEQEGDLSQQVLLQSLISKEILFVPEVDGKLEKNEKLEKNGLENIYLLPEGKEYLIEKNTIKKHYKKAAKGTFYSLYVPSGRKQNVDVGNKKSVLIGKDNPEIFARAVELAANIKDGASFGYITTERGKNSRKADFSLLVQAENGWREERGMSVKSKEKGGGLRYEAVTPREIENGKVLDFILMKGYKAEYAKFLESYVVLMAEDNYTLMMQRHTTYRYSDKEQDEDIFSIGKKWAIVWKRNKEKANGK